MYDVTKDNPERFKRAVRAACCCDACPWPECSCEETAEIARKVINEWNHIPDRRLEYGEKYTIRPTLNAIDNGQ